MRGKLIRICGECANYDWKKHRCKLGCNEGEPQEPFYTDCPLPTVDTDPKWISVSERLPEPNELVLAVLNEPSFRLNFPYNEQVLILLREKIPYSVGMVEEWKRPFSGETVNYNGRVTHWMPLPEPPKGD